MFMSMVVRVVVCHGLSVSGLSRVVNDVSCHYIQDTNFHFSYVVGAVRACIFSFVTNMKKTLA